MPSWPETLPAVPLLDGFHETVPDAVIRTSMEQGPAKARRRSTAAVRLFELHYLLDRAQLAALDAFFLTTLMGGVLPFGFPHPRGGGTLSCRFVRPPEYAAANGAYFRATCMLEALP